MISLLDIAFSVLVFSSLTNAVEKNASQNKESRGARVVGRIVKLSSDINTLSIHCDGEGFQRDEHDCAIFYRCVKSTQHRYTIFRFQCSPGTIYDPETEVCNFPRNTKRSECFNYVNPDETHTPETNDVNNEANEIETIPFPKPEKEMNKLKEQSRHTILDLIFNKHNNHKIRSTSIKPVAKTKQKEVKICTEEGFVGDKEDCQKFYRCVANGRGGFIRYEFSCSELTIWDDESKSCNHFSSVKRSQCNINNEINEKTLDFSSDQQTTKNPFKPSIQEQTQISYGSQVSQIQVQLNNGSTIQNQTQISYGDQNNQSQRQENQGYENHQTQHQISHGSAISQSQNQINHGNKSVQNQVQIDHTQQTSQSQSQSFETSDNPNENNNVHSNTNNNKHGCQTSGFMGDTEDCRKFYRCVDNGKGGYTKYEFTCGEGTVWDQSIEGCNHKWAVKNCAQSQSSESSPDSTTTIMTSTNTTIHSEEVTSEMSPPSPSPSNSEPSSTESMPQTSTPHESHVSNNNSCTYNGFIGDDNDCTKFYRCVDNGNGGYTRYEFKCGQGTVWDPEIQACNHDWAVAKCGGTSTDYNKVESTTKVSNIQNEPLPDTNIETNNNEIDPALTTTQQPDTENYHETSDNGNNCTEEGFKGDNHDCKKFYRCVDNGNGGYTKYEFSCGEGTVWDQDILGCNHPSGTKKCNNQSNTPVSTTQQTQNVDTTTTESIHSTTTNQPSSSSMDPHSSFECDSNGFFANPDNCQSFYRCVDNGEGRYIKYEFSCGEGTIWDQEIQACNHDNGKQNCKRTPTSKPSETSQVDSSTETSTSTTTNSPLEPPQSGENECQSEGFYANTKDCKKFYRCVNNGNGDYTKYDFSCGDGTVWMQEIQACDHDNDINSCNSQTNNDKENQSPTLESTQNQQSTSSPPSIEADEYPNEISNENHEETSSDEQCHSEGFYQNKKDCRKFYRCVDDGQGTYSKYDFTCGEGTAWDTNINSCNHIDQVESCKSQQQASSVASTDNNGEYSTTTTSSTTTSSSTTTLSSSNSSPPTDTNQSENKDKCTEEGFYGNSKDCKKFYRCVDNGKGGYTKYDFSCGEGTIWDQDLTTCNHPADVKNPQCSENEAESPSPISNQNSESSTESSTSSNTSENYNDETQSNCTHESSTNQSAHKNITCTKAGFYADPEDCKKFYRCVDWENNGEKFSVYHFECGEGTIWDPALDTCNHEDSVYPARDCNRQQTQNENVTNSSTTEKEETVVTESSSTTEKDCNSSQPSSTEKEETVVSESTTTTEKDCDNTKPSSTEQSSTQQTTTTSEKPTTIQSTTTEQQTTTQTNTESSTTQQTTTTETSTTEKTTTNEPSTSEQPTTTESTTTQQPTTENVGTSTEQTTSYSTTQTSNETTTTESTTLQTTSEATTTQQPSTTQKEETTTQQSSTQTEENTTTDSSTSEDNTEESTDKPMDKECPETEDGQYLFVCPTGFRRHPKYCNLFYQCTIDDNNHETKIAVFQCPNNTIYDENKTQCVEEEKADKKCNGQIAQKRRLKRLNSSYLPLMEVSSEMHSCSAAGHFPLEKQHECSEAFLKCQKSKSGNIRRMVYQCPENYVYWAVSRRCERKANVKGCKNTGNNWSGRWEIPIERRNVAP